MCLQNYQAMHHRSQSAAAELLRKGKLPDAKLPDKLPARGQPQAEEGLRQGRDLGSGTPLCGRRGGTTNGKSVAE